MAVQKILVAEDSTKLRTYISENLQNSGYAVLEAPSGDKAFDILKNEYVDLVLLDLNLGDMDGMEILKTIRRQDDLLPVIIVSSITSHDSKLTGFSSGCDDYITKPFYVDELLARVQRMLKKAAATNRPDTPLDETIQSGPFTLNLGTMRVTKNGKPLVLRKKLFSLFLYFIKNPDLVLSNSVLFSQVWDPADEVNDNSLYVHIRQLRSHVEDDPDQPKFIKTVRNAGYRYTPAP